MTTVEVFKAVADETRLRILHVLGFGAFNVQELTGIINIGQPTVSHHLKILQQAGLVSSRREGTWAFYQLTHPAATDSTQDQSEPLAHLLHSILFYLTANPNGLGPTLHSDQAAIDQTLNRRRDKSRVFFESVAKDWRNIRLENQGLASFLDHIAERIPPKITLLELGCGTGSLLELILPRPGKTIGVDASQAMLDEARATLKKSGAEVDLRLGTFEHLPVGDESVDMAVAYMVLHHAAEPQKAIEDSYRALKTEGTLVIVDLMPHENEYLRERFAHTWLGLDPDDLARAAKKIGFSASKREFLGDKKDIFVLTLTK